MTARVLRVRVHFNFHKKCWSVLVKCAAGWRLLKHTKFAVLTDCKFKVSEAGRQRVLREKRKNVHAFVEGDLVDGVPINVWGAFLNVTYNPYKFSTFVITPGDTPIYYAQCVVMRDQHVTANP